MRASRLYRQASESNSPDIFSSKYCLNKGYTLRRGKEARIVNAGVERDSVKLQSVTKVVGVRHGQIPDFTNVSAAPTKLQRSFKSVSIQWDFRQANLSIYVSCAGAGGRIIRSPLPNLG